MTNWLEKIPIGYDLADKDCSGIGYEIRKHFVPNTTTICPVKNRIIRERDLTIDLGNSALGTWECNCGTVFEAYIEL